RSLREYLTHRSLRLPCLGTPGPWTLGREAPHAELRQAQNRFSWTDPARRRLCSDRFRTEQKDPPLSNQLVQPAESSPYEPATRAAYVVMNDRRTRREESA